MNSGRMIQVEMIQRISIAHEVLTAILFLHHSDDTFDGCFHRDIKSANIILTNELKAKLIVCGLDKLAIKFDTRFSGIGVKGTPGYVCPEYQSYGDGYEARCDIFSFGVVLTELLTGRLQNYQTTDNRSFNFLREYVMGTNPRNLVDDMDSTLNLLSTCDLPEYVKDFSILALDCMSYLISDRPIGNVVMDRLESIKNSCSNNDNELQIEGNSSDKLDDLSMIRQKLTDLENKVDKVLIKLDNIIPVLTALDAKFNK
jgi:serine/threonine protein kinase